MWRGDPVLGSSQLWFWSIFARVCLPFQSVHAWEKSVHDPSDAMRGVPALIKPNYHWFNVPVTTGEGDADNPLLHVATVAHPDDYVLMKLDIDTVVLEEALVDQLLRGDTLLTLVDEFIWEHHVVFPSLQPYWGLEPGMKDQEATIALLSQLRRRGVRAHSWV